MARTVQVVTPESIPLTLELAGIGTRFGAFLLDGLIQVCIAIVFLLILAILSAVGYGLEAQSGIFSALMIIGLFLLIVGYPILFETIWNGQTPGKRAFNLRVIRDGGYPANFFAVATRNLMRIADFLPISYTFGALAIFFNPQYQRLGDMVAGTLVVKEKRSEFQGFAPARAAANGNTTNTSNQVTTGLPPGVLNPYDVLSADELSILRRFAVRRWQMSSDDSERIAYRLIAPLVPRLGVTFAPGAPPRYADLASALASASEQREAELAELSH